MKQRNKRRKKKNEMVEKRQKMDKKRKQKLAFCKENKMRRKEAEKGGPERGWAKIVLVK